MRAWELAKMRVKAKVKARPWVSNHDYKKNPCYELTRVPANGRKRCPQCWKIKSHPSDFVGLSGRVVQICTACSCKKGKYLKRWRRTAKSGTTGS